MGDLLLCGYLKKMKKSGFLNNMCTQWNDRWFAVEECKNDFNRYQLSYFHSPHSTKCEASILIKDILFVCKFKDGTSGSFLVDTVDRTYVLRSHSIVEMEGWVNGLQMYIARERPQQNGRPLMPSMPVIDLSGPDNRKGWERPVPPVPATKSKDDHDDEEDSNDDAFSPDEESYDINGETKATTQSEPTKLSSSLEPKTTKSEPITSSLVSETPRTVERKKRVSVLETLSKSVNGNSMKKFPSLAPTQEEETIPETDNKSSLPVTPRKEKEDERDAFSSPSAIIEPTSTIHKTKSSRRLGNSSSNKEKNITKKKKQQVKGRSSVEGLPEMITSPESQNTRQIGIKNNTKETPIKPPKKKKNKQKYSEWDDSDDGSSVG